MLIKPTICPFYEYYEKFAANWQSADLYICRNPNNKLRNCLFYDKSHLMADCHHLTEIQISK